MKAIVTVLALTASLCSAQDLKGVTVGMTRAEYAQYLLNGGSLGNSIAGAKAVHGPSIEWRHDRIYAVVYAIRPKDFDDVLSAFRAKYPSITCEVDQVQTRMGVRLDNHTCVYKNFIMIRYVGSIDTSSVAIIDRSAIRSEVQQAEKRSREDI